jgi:hypothetical protein
MATSPAPNKTKQVQEIIRCGKDPVYFFNTYVKIQHPTKGLLSFKTYPFQDDCVKDFIDHRFNIVVKSRQLGLSTLTAAYAVWLALFQKDKNILIIATKLQVAQNFIKKTKTILRNLPPWLVLPQVVADNKQFVEFSHGSSIKAVPTSDDAGRSESLSLLIVDEAAFVRNFDELWTGLYPTLSTGGRAIILSTPNGVGGQYYKLYKEAESGVNEFNPIKLNWDVHPERDQSWFDKETRNMSSRQVAQELLCDFASSGETFLGDDELKWVYANIKTPIDRKGLDRNVWIWRYPLAESKYLISADVARGDGKDYSTFHVIDLGVGDVVAEYRGKIAPDRFGDLLYEFGMLYNKALLCPENNTYGYATIIKLRDLNYPRMYYQKSNAVYIGDYIPPGETETAGFNTSGKTRGLILTKLEELLRNKQLVTYSSRFYDELKTFVWQDNRVSAMKGENDDLVMSLAIGSWLYDASAEHSRDSGAINRAMLAGMAVNANHFNGASNSIMRNEHIRNVQAKRDLVTGGIRNQPGMIPPEFAWVFKG